MNSSIYAGLGDGHQGAKPISDEKMEQVRELLFGEFEKQTEQRVTALEERISELEASMNRRIDALQARLEALSGEVDADQRHAHQEIAAGLQELSDRMRQLGNS